MIQNKSDIRYQTEVQILVIDIGELAELMERTTQTIRLWERKGVTPPALWRDGRGYRFCSEDQVKAFLSCKYYLEMRMESIAESIFAIEIKKTLEAMPNGIVVIPMVDNDLICSRD